MKVLVTRTMTGVCLGMLLFYAYAAATVEPVPVWNPQPTINYGCCYFDGLRWVCFCREGETK